MLETFAENPPATNLQGLKEYWRNDLIAGFSVALVALPLALGIATAAGAPAISGLVSAILAGLFTTFVRGSKIAINGPGNSLIVIIASGFAVFGDDPGAFSHILGAVVVAGGMQVAFGLLRLGRLGDLIPSAVVQGLLAAIGLIIVGKQAHVLFGRTPPPGSPIAAFAALPETLGLLNPAAALIGVVSLLALIAHPRLKSKWLHFVPAPLWVVIITVPMALAFSRYGAELTAASSSALSFGPELLVKVPDDLVASLVRPDFSRIGEPGFWGLVATLALVTSMENIVSVKAVDKLDSYRRQSDMNRDLIAVGLSTALAGMLGGLPILTVIARSSVNVNHGATTGWSNFFHGLILLVFVLFLAPLIESIALAALAGILVYTGFKLTAPHVVEDTLRKGPDHFLVFGVTIAATLTNGLLWGIGVGLAAELLSHLLILGFRPPEAARSIWQTRVESTHESAAAADLLRVVGVANYLNIPRLRTAFEGVTSKRKVIVDFDSAMLVDNTLLEYTREFGRRYRHANPGASFAIVGLEAHRAIADHPDALHAQERRHHAKRLTKRQGLIAESAKARGWSFDARRDWDPDHLDDFHFFRLHPVEYRDTVVRGRYDLACGAVEFTLCDVTFDEGALIPEVYHTTVQVLRLPERVPELILEKEEMLDRALEFAGFQDVDFKHFTKFSRRFVLKTSDEEAIRAFMTPERLSFFEREDVYHLESSGQEVVVFKTFMRRATPGEIERMVAFSERLAEILVCGSLTTVDACATERGGTNPTAHNLAP